MSGEARTVIGDLRDPDIDRDRVERVTYEQGVKRAWASIAAELRWLRLHDPGETTVDWETTCSKRESGRHCTCWYDGKACCACGAGEMNLAGKLEAGCFEQGEKDGGDDDDDTTAGGR